ncbi:MAG TPA: sigma-54 dependent transcriptional regulator [Alphaproteobacteria bacterium]|nr:sigma-54 dependent transcriptional regulator [Alphaproteobacteria bacterium]
MPLGKKTILLVEDTAPLARIYEDYLRQDRYDVIVAEDGHSALNILSKSPPAGIVLDLLLPDINGLEVLEQSRHQYPEIPVVVATINNSIDVAVEAMKRGAYDFIVKPFPAARLTITLRNALERKQLTSEVAEWRQMVGQEKFQNFVGQSGVMQAVYRSIDAVAPSKASVFLLGENGTGKELAAQSIHNAGPRRSKPFIAVNCAAIPHDLIETTLFGHIKGAFTGAISDQPGAAMQAHCGTLFLDEICEMPIDMQAKLLRFAQSGEVTAVGSSRTEFADVRIIAATNRDPLIEIESRRLREDLYYRLHVLPIEMPALRDRDEDVLMLAQHFLARFNVEEGKHFTGFSPDVLRLFRRYDWPGNVRQLENVIRNVVVLNEGSMVTERMLPHNLQRFVQESKPKEIHDLVLVDFKSSDSVKPLWIAEKEAIMHALEFTRHDITQAAALLEVSPSTLYRKLQLWRNPEALVVKPAIMA